MDGGGAGRGGRFWARGFFDILIEYFLIGLIVYFLVLGLGFLNMFVLKWDLVVCYCCCPGWCQIIYKYVFVQPALGKASHPS